MTEPSTVEVFSSAEDDDYWRNRIDAGEVSFADVVRLKFARTLTASTNATTKNRGDRFYQEALNAFRTKTQESSRGTVEAAVFDCGIGTYHIGAQGLVWYTIIERWIGFDWSAAHRLLNRVDVVYKQAREQWPARAPDKGTRWAKRSRQERRRRREAVARSPHVEQAYLLMTSLFSAVNLEKLARIEAAKPSGQKPSAAFSGRIALVREQVVEAETELRRAAQRSAREHYASGLARGMLALFALCAIAGGVFACLDLGAWQGIAFLGGGLGAGVSVLQRMTTNRLTLDSSSGADMLRALGSVRPFVGATLGMALFTLLAGGWLPSIQPPKSNLAFYAALGFLAGFNERFAQDMLSNTARAVLSKSSGDEPENPTDGGAPPASGGSAASSSRKT